jgi:hypothetical protein
MELPRANFSKALLAEKIPGGRAAVSNTLSRLRQGYGGPRDNALHLLTSPSNQGELGRAGF